MTDAAGPGIVSDPSNRTYLDSNIWPLPAYMPQAALRPVLKCHAFAVLPHSCMYCHTLPSGTCAP
jgi:hypothetical protein